MLRRTSVIRPSVTGSSPARPSIAQLLPVGALAAFVLAAAAGCHDRPAQAAPAAPDLRAHVSVALPVHARVADFSEHTGRADAAQVVEVRPRVSGQIVRAPFREGDLVRAGELLFVIDPRPFEVTLAHARAELAAVRADLELAQKNAARDEQLAADHALPQRDLDGQRAQVASLTARAAVAAAEVDRAQLDVEWAYVRAPIAGRVGRRLVTEGNLAGPQMPSPLTTVVSVDPLYVYVDVDENRALALGRGEKIAAHVGLAGESGFSHEARLDFIDNHVDASSGTVKVRAVIPNRDGKLTPGLFARVRLPAGAASDALLVADSAVATDQDRRLVWVVDAAGQVHDRRVTLGPLSDGLRVIKSGLDANDRVVVRGLQRVQPGALVVAEEIPMRSATAARGATP